MKDKWNRKYCNSGSCSPEFVDQIFTVGPKEQYDVINITIEVKQAINGNGRDISDHYPVLGIISVIPLGTTRS